MTALLIVFALFIIACVIGLDRVLVCIWEIFKFVLVVGGVITVIALIV